MSDADEINLPDAAVPVTVAIDGQWYSVGEATVSQDADGNVIAEVKITSPDGDKIAAALGMPGHVGVTIGPLPAV